MIDALGAAIGVMGMSLGDFESLEPCEWSAICRAWNTHTDAAERSAWERSRWLVSRLLQPYSKKPLRALDVGRFPWDEPEVRVERKSRGGGKRIENKAEAERRMAAAIKKLGRHF